MKPMIYIHVFAGISITALCLQIMSDFWLPLILGALAMFVVAMILRK
ncbi:MAG: hypothetical protein NTV46_22515 [Verrucomicrobia bacterium]|nr:hypothetical protein [Verrucomicrobiota bacterium]